MTKYRETFGVKKSRGEIDQQNMKDVEKNDEEIDQQGTRKPVLAFRAQGLPHSEVKEAEIGRVRELIGQIENRPNQKDLQEDLRQNNVYTPVSDNSKKMIREVGNVERLKIVRNRFARAMFLLSDIVGRRN